ncbi:uncharacterized protein F4812DRAFT_209472 [Daldinia caldariorum]|uniref:uncharacterized protein n=1 Tax=Daldinia caldariorum TaxID=326644 RepID=UPI002007E41F|nr:uncharacterized protein F4812DRAFT_209472 [Daldinia caldariorum]KAI1464372.1 hypothetical protein F4812DRAFT_209472 [Daldinia caldariorum]
METPALTGSEGDVKILLKYVNDAGDVLLQMTEYLADKPIWPVFSIFMVNFPTTSARDGFIPMVEMVEHLVPEAVVTKLDLELSCTTSNPSGYDLGPAPGSSASDINLPSDWITSQARSLLERMRHNTSNGAAILLSGYGLGGILVKQVGHGVKIRESSVESMVSI